MLKAGFARIDITPPFGIYVSGYYEPRVAESMLDPLQANAIAFSDGTSTAVLICADLIGMDRKTFIPIRDEIALACKVPASNIFITCTHTHTGPEIDGHLFPLDPVYNKRLALLLVQAARLAVDDLKPCTLHGAWGEAKDISFIRRFQMKDGSYRTNPGRHNPDIDHPIGVADESMRIVRILREGGKDILLTNFQVHPDVVTTNLAARPDGISGCPISADYPGFVRRTLENALPDVHCVYLNGTAGDLNHINVNCPEWDENQGYEQSRHMGYVIAGAALSLYQKTVPLTGDTVKASETIVRVPANKSDPSTYATAENYIKLHKEERDDLIPFTGMELVTVVAEAERIYRLKDAPDFFELPISALRVGGLCLAGFPGEPFCDMGRYIRDHSPAQMQFTGGLLNGNEGYFPMKNAFDEGGYEARSSNYKSGVAESLMEAATELVSKICQ